VFCRSPIVRPAPAYRSGWSDRAAWRTWSIRRLFNLVLVVLLVPSSLLLAYSIRERQQDQINGIQASSLTLARISAQDAVSLIDNARYILDGLTQRPLVHALDPDSCDPILRDVRRWFREFANLSTIDRSGQVICNASSAPDQKLPNYSGREWFGKVFGGKSFLIGAPVVGGTTGLWVVPLVQPMFGDDGKMIGVLSLTTNLARFKPKFAREEFPVGTEVSIVDSAGTYVARSSDLDAKDWLGQRFPEPQLLATVLGGRGEGTTSVRYRGTDEVDYVAGFTGVPGTNWHVIAAIPTRIITASARDSAILNIIAVALVLALAVGVAAFVLRNIEKSISSIAATAQAHVRGEVTARAAEIGPREIVAVAGQFNLMLDARRKAEDELLAQKQQLDAAINNMSQGLLLLDSSERIVVCNQRYVEMHGLSADVMEICRTFRELVAHQTDAGSLVGDVEQYHRELLATLDKNTSSGFTAQTGDGRSIRIITRPTANGGWVLTHEDVTERRRTLLDLERTQAFLNTVIENVPATIYVKDAREQRYILANRAAEQMWGKLRAEVLGKTALEIFPKATAEAIVEHDLALLTSKQSMQSRSTHWVQTPSGRFCLVMTKRITIFDEDGEPKYLIGVVEDITERERANDRIAYMAHHDLLTGLANRALFLEKIAEAGERLRRRGETFTVLMLDLDRFKDVNDSLGHPAGDALLQEVARRLKSSLGEADVLARLGGDEFAILQGGEAQQRLGAHALAAKIIDSLGETFDVDGSKVVIATSIGIAQAPEDGIEHNELMKKADLALYRKKTEGRNGYRFFDAKMMAEADARHRLGHDLRNAISNGELELHYQPFIDVKTREICGVEALLRWHHPQRGDIAPSEFIPLAEENGSIVPIGRWVLRKALVDAASWPPHIRVAINVSPVQLKQPDLLDVILSALVDSGLSAGRVELEITESVLIESYMDILPVIRQLKNLGVSIALDDFGTGYSSLSYLTMFPFDKIKIDRSFTQNLTNRAECAAIVSSVVALGRGLDIVTTAEGVETEEQFELLRAAGVNLAQGYLFGRPCPLAVLDFAPAAADRPAADAA
jgi:diguanylate cyclase (GGDEF)-like protein/PAS domain S-box-containing protein